MIDFQPSEEQQLVIDTVRGFAQKEIRPVARDSEETRTLPAKVLEQAHELGLVANALPEAAGGGGERSAVTGALIAEELAWGDLAVALAILSPALSAFPLAEWGDEAQRRMLAGFVGADFRPGALALVEPRFDFDPFRPLTIARSQGDGYLLDGAKCLVPWLPGADPVLVVASEAGRAAPGPPSHDAGRAAPGPPSHDAGRRAPGPPSHEAGTPQAFWVPRDAPGLTAEPEQNMGIQALPTAELRFAGVRVPASARLGGAAGADLRRLVNQGRVALAAMAVGVARAAFETARDYARERQVFGVPVATKQAIAFKLADMAIEIDGARLLAWEAAWKLDRGDDATREALLARRQASRVALDVADGAVQVLGGHGYIRDYLPELHLRNARGFASFEALALV